jgi:hypothetical protein
MADHGRNIKDRFRAVKERIPSATAIQKSARQLGHSVVDKVTASLSHGVDQPNHRGAASSGGFSFTRPLHGRGECVQLIKCAEATRAELENPDYIPQLELTEEAKEIISTHFQAPISIIVYVGDMGVGKSKLATVTINTLHQTKPRHLLQPFRSGSGAKGVTHGVWMWADPLPHPSGEGTVMLLDCEGMGDINEHLGANLYLFCMIISTSFALVLRPPRIQRAQCDRLYHALLRFEKMKSAHILPNFWLIPELREYVSDDQKMGETVITKKQWLNLAFNYTDQDNSQRLGTADARTLQERFNKINDMLPGKDVVKLARLPKSLVTDSKDSDVWSLLRKPDAEAYFSSIESLLQQLLSTGGKVMPGSESKELYIRPNEFAAFMTELVNTINKDQMPNPDSLVERYLRARFQDEIVKEKRAKLDSELLVRAQELSALITQRQRLENEQEEREISEQMANYRQNLIQKYLGEIIRLARYQILGLAEGKIDVEFLSIDKQQEAAKELPASIQKDLIQIEKDMNAYKEPEELIEETRSNMKIKDHDARMKAIQIAEQNAKDAVDRAVLELQKQQRIINAINRPNQGCQIS